MSFCPDGFLPGWVPVHEQRAWEGVEKRNKDERVNNGQSNAALKAGK